MQSAFTLASDLRDLIPNRRRVFVSNSNLASVPIVWFAESLDYSAG